VPMSERVVLLRRSSLGDVVLLGAVTSALDAHVTVVTDRRWVEIVERLNGVDAVSVWPDIPKGTVVDLQGSLRSFALAPLASRIRKRSLRRRLRIWTGRGGRPPVPSLYGEACGVRPGPPPWIDVSGRRDGLALVPGAAWPLKRAPVSALIAAGRAWRGPVMVLGGPGEQELVSSVARHIPGAGALAETGFGKTLEVLGHTRVALCGDTGLMHLAGACGATVVALFGPTHPDDGFFVYPGRVVQRALACRPCALHRVTSCQRGDHACMSMDIEAVVEAVTQCAG
jgi:ADP-heptose:LPS heptosyltransferase